MTTISKHALLDIAKAAVADRGLNYGAPEDNFKRIALRWTVHLVNRYGLDVAIDAVDVAIMGADIKLARLENQPKHLDSWADLAGYAACGANLVCPDPIIEKLAKVDFHVGMKVTGQLADGTKINWTITDVVHAT